MSPAMKSDKVALIVVDMQNDFCDPEDGTLLVSALFRVVPIPLRHHISVPRQVSGANGHTASHRFFTNLGFRLKKLLLTPKCAG